MKPDWIDETELDDLIESPEKRIAREIETKSIVGPWESFIVSPNDPNLKTIVELTEASIWSGVSASIARNLFLYNSKAIIIEGPNNHKLIALPDVCIIVDIFSLTREIFVGKTEYNDVDSIIEKILVAIGRGNYVYNSLCEAQSVINALKKDCYLYAHKIEKGDILAQGTHIFKMEFCGVILNKLFYGKHNWACGMSYFNSIDSFKNSLLQYDVFCYECMPYVREEGKYCIETKLPLEASKVNIDHYDENRRVAILACQSANNPEAEGWQGETALKFLGIYNLDIAKSKEENYLAFKLANKCLYI